MHQMVWGRAPAAHYTVDSITVGGMKFPTMRRVVTLRPSAQPMHNGPIPTLINLVFRRIEPKGSVDTDDSEHEWDLTDASSVDK